MAINNALNAPIPFVVGKGGTGATSLTDGGVLLGAGTGAITALGQANDGELVIGSTGGSPVLGSLTEGAGITITNGAGSITISADSGIIWNDQTGDAVTMSSNNGYVVNATNLCTLTIPATAKIGDVFAISGNSANGWMLQANTGQTVNFGDDPTSSAGSISSTNQYDAIEIVCTADDTTFSVLSSQGNMTVA